MVPSFSGSSSQAALFKLVDPEDDGTAIFRNAGLYLTTRRLETSIHIKFRDTWRNNNLKDAGYVGEVGGCAEWTDLAQDRGQLTQIHDWVP